MFELVNDVTSVMTNIVTSASEVASKHEHEKKQLEADKLVPVYVICAETDSRSSPCKFSMRAWSGAKQIFNT